MVAEIRSDGTSSRSAAGEIHQALPKLRDQLQSRGRYGAPLHRETKRHRSPETVERIRETAFLATIAKRIAVISKERRKVQNIGSRYLPALKLSCCPRSFAATLAALPSISENPFPRFLRSSEIFFMRTERQSWMRPGDD